MVGAPDPQREQPRSPRHRDERCELGIDDEKAGADDGDSNGPPGSERRPMDVPYEREQDTGERQAEHLRKQLRNHSKRRQR